MVCISANDVLLDIASHEQNMHCIEGNEKNTVNSIFTPIVAHWNTYAIMHARNHLKE